MADNMYDVKPIKPDPMNGPAMAGDGEESAKFPCLCIPIDTAWFDKLKVGSDATFSVTGKIMEISTNDPEKIYKRNEVELEVRKVELDKSEEYKELLDA